MATPTGRPMRVGVIGTGFGANVHVPALKASEDFEVIAIVSAHRDKAERVAQEHGIAWASDDYRAMLREVDLDVVSIATPGGLHHEMVLAAAQARRHILCEKPFAASVAEAREMVAAVREAGVGHAVNHEFRMIPARQTLRRMVEQGFLGTTWDVRAQLDMGMLLNPSHGWSWWADRNQQGGMLQAMTSHLIDFLLWTFGDIRSLSARLDTFIRSRRAVDGTKREVTSDDQNAALLRFESGASGLIYVSGVSRAQRSIIEVHGSDASLRIDNNILQVAREPGKFEAVETPPAEGPVRFMSDYLSHVARVFRGESDENVATFDQGLRVQAVMDAMHASSDNGGNRVEPAGALGGDPRPSRSGN